MEIELCGYKVLIDDEDSWLVRYYLYSKAVKKGSIYFYRKYYENGKRVTGQLHRDIVGCVLYDGKIIDHINGNTLDNRKENLRVCTVAENARNSKTRGNNKSGYKWVYFNKKTNKFCSGIKVNGKLIYLGKYATPQEAHAAYCEASKKYHGEFGRTE